MLVLTRRIGESVRIDGEIEVTLLDIKGDSVRIGVKAPRETRIQRTEIIEAVGAENRSAAADTGADAEAESAITAALTRGREKRTP
ncbi:carbon storage regulator CsrA [Microbacterium sp. p3-SID336]|uniref:carbon storage regulator CsrA n=1 Tax=Microbacterium sp. p3-SID336 TaxID=2916212 RepID=UPI0021A28C19|nr:carbon storage regulator CsrA [Microbacterium sp. p3-SID336]